LIEKPRFTGPTVPSSVGPWLVVVKPVRTAAEATPAPASIAVATAIATRCRQDRRTGEDGMC
jgi:hypothetical protein